MWTYIFATMRCYAKNIELRRHNNDITCQCSASVRDKIKVFSCHLDALNDKVQCNISVLELAAHLSYGLLPLKRLHYNRDANFFTITGFSNIFVSTGVPPYKSPLGSFE